MPNHLHDISGQRFGRWTVVGRARDRRGRVEWLCCCDCGKEKVIRASKLKDGTTQSCGCLRSEFQSFLHHKHGAAATGTTEKLYRVWGRMKERCLNPNSDGYSHYGGRGITVCERWLHSYEAFRDDMPPWPGPGYSIDRIDVNGNYEPANCRWATAREQRQNQRPRTHCRRGHPFVPENLYYSVLRDGRIRRVCRTCALQWQHKKRGQSKTE